MRPIILGLIAVSFVFNGCANETVDPNLTRLDVDFSWPQGQVCHDIVSPEIRIGNIPTEAKIFRIEWIDPVSDRHPGGGEIAYTGNGLIPEGALKGYTAPCIEGWGSVEYEMTVTALDQERNVVGIGKKARRWPPNG